jgi:hypothetical protein
MQWMKTKFKTFQKPGGGNDMVSVGFMSDEQRRELFEERIRTATHVIDTHESANFALLTVEETREGLFHLHEQHMILMQAAEEDLVDVYVFD